MGRARIAVYALAGLYLIYSAVKIFQNLGAAGSEKPILIIFIVLFGLLGAAMVGAGFYSTWKSRKDEAEKKENQQKK